MLRPYTQSLIYVVSHKIDARFLMCECIKADSSIKLRMLNYLQRLILILPFHAPHADSFTSCMIPVETSTTPDWFTVIHSVNFTISQKQFLVNSYHSSKIPSSLPVPTQKKEIVRDHVTESSESTLLAPLQYPSGFQ